MSRDRDRHFNSDDDETGRDETCTTRVSFACNAIVRVDTDTKRFLNGTLVEYWKEGRTLTVAERLKTGES